MGTTRIKVIDLSSDKKEIKTARKHAEKIALAPKKQSIETSESEKPKEKVENDSPAKEETQTPDDSKQIETSEKESEKTRSPKTKKTKAAKQTHRNSAKYKKAKEILGDKVYTAKEAIEILPKVSYTKFDPTVEIHFNVSEKNIRGSVSLPHPFKSKKSKKYLVFSDKKTDAANILWGDEKTIDEIISGKIKPGRDFDVVMSTPKFMPSLTKVAKVLGPKGLMPNPKNGTIIDSPEKALTKDSENLYEYKTDPTAPIVHAKLGKLSDKPEMLHENLKALVTSIGPSKIKNAALSSTMSPSIKIETARI